MAAAVSYLTTQVRVWYVFPRTDDLESRRRVNRDAWVRELCLAGDDRGGRDSYDASKS